MEAAMAIKFFKGQVIVSTMERKGKTIEAVAYESETSIPTVNRARSGQVKTMTSLAPILGVLGLGWGDLDWLPVPTPKRARR